MDVAEWLRSLGLERYAQAFQDAEVTPEVLPELTEADLRELGLAPRPAQDGAEGDPGSRFHGGSRRCRDRAGRTDQTRSAPPSEAERRQLTVMFVDLVGSTALASGRDPEELRDLIQVYQNTVAGEITRFEGHVAKFLGDGVLAYFGWPRAHEDDAERAVRAGLRVTEAVAGLRDARWRSRWPLASASQPVWSLSAI